MTDTTTPRILTPTERQAIRERYGDSTAPICKEHGTPLVIGGIEDGVIEYACLRGKISHYWYTRVNVPVRDSRVVALLDALDAADARIAELGQSCRGIMKAAKHYQERTDARLERWRRVVKAVARYYRTEDADAADIALDGILSAFNDLLASRDAVVSDA